MGLTLITAPPVTPLSLDEVKAHLRVSGTDQDSVIQMYLDAATNYVDGEGGFLGRALVTQTWSLVLDGFPENEIKIPLPPLQEVTSVRYDDSDGNEQIVPVTDYYVDTASEPGWLIPVTTGWPTPLDGVNTVRIEFVAGYAATLGSPPDYRANIPASIKHAMLLLITDWMEHRQNMITQAGSFNIAPYASDTLLRRHKIDVGFA